MQARFIVSFLMVAFSAVAAVGQQPPPVPVEPPTPGAPSPKIDRVLSQIRQLDELREENKQLLARLRELETRSQQLADVELRGVIVGPDGAAAALLQFDGQTQLVRPGSEVALVSRKSADGAQRIMVKQIIADGVQLQIGGSSEMFFVR